MNIDLSKLTNFRPTLTISDVVINENDPTAVIKNDSEVNASQELEGGLYSFNHGSASSPSCSDHGTLTIHPTNGEISFGPALNYNGVCNVRVKFTNKKNISTDAQFKITVISDNFPPVITSACATTVNELAAYSCTGANTDTEGDTITWSLAAGNTCSWAVINPTTGNITGTPARADVGTCNLIVNADDSQNITSRTYAITVNNLQPVVNIANTTLAEDAGATIIRTDSAVTSTDEGHGTYSLIAATAPACQSFGVVSIDASNGEITFDPNDNYDQTCNIRVSFNDGKATNNIGTREFSVAMIPSPDNATVSLPVGCNNNVNEDVLYSCTPVITDPDTGNTHTWSVDANTCSAFISLTAATGRMSGTAHDDQVGACTFTIKATGNQDSLVSATLTANFNIVNVRPVLSGTSPQNIFMRYTTAPPAYSAVVKNVASTFNINSTDENRGVYSLGTASATACSDIADTLSIDTTTGVVTFLPNDLYSGTCKIKVEFDDQNSTNNIAISYEFTVNVLDQVPPQILYIDSTTADGTYNLNDTINILVKFNEQVVLNTAGGSPRIFLETGAIDRQAIYTGQGGTNNTELYFTYTVQEGDSSLDLGVHSTVSFLDLAGATLADGSTNTLASFPIPKAVDATGNSLSERRAIVIDGATANATVTGLPTLVSPATFLDGTVSGTGVVDYQYKLKKIGDPNDSCSDGTDYSANIPVATKITNSLITYPIGSKLRICVVGVTNTGVVEPYANAFVYEWSKDINSIERVDFTTVTNLPNWQDAEIDPDNNNIVYARNLLGIIYKSVDYGVTWEKQCRLPQTYATSMEISPGPDRTPYVFQNGSVFKIVNNGGSSCTNLSSNLPGLSGTILTEYGRRMARFATNGDLYVVTTGFGGVKVYRTFNQGASWSSFATLSPAAVNEYFSFTLNPDNVNIFYYSTIISNSNPVNGLYKTINGGTSFTKLGLEKNRNLHLNINDPNIVYHTYRAFSQKSLDAGATWASAGESSYVTSGYTTQRFDMDKVTGHAYRLMVSGADTVFQRATNITSPGVVTWTTLYTFNGVSGDHMSTMNVSVSGNPGTPASPSIVVNINNRMWTSVDGGSTFTEKFAPDELELVTIAGAGDDYIYGATIDWNVVRTSDNGETWTYKVGDYSHCLGKGPRLQVNQLDPANILMWTENYGVNDCDNFNYSVDSMDTMISRNEFSMVAPKLAVSMSAHNPKQYLISGKPGSNDFRFHETNNSAFETLLKYSTGNQFTNPMPDSYIHPHKSNVTWIADDSGTGILYEYDVVAETRTNITARTGLFSIAAIDVYPGDEGTFFLRVMDRAGRMKVSSDYGLNFVDQGTTGFPLTPCTKRFLYHHTRDRNLVVSACVSGNTVAVSRDKGTTWDETDLLTEYDINCGITGLAVSSSKLYMACQNAGTMVMNYSFASIENDVADSVLTAAEHALSNDLVSHFFPDLYTTVEYAVIPASSNCDGSVGTFSTTIPKSDDPAFTTRGDYKVCIKQTDSSASITYTTTSTIFYDNEAPIFTSIALVNNASDGEITYVDYFERQEIVGNLIASKSDFVKYAVVSTATTCDNSIKYDFEIPKSNHVNLKSSGSYKVCVQLTTRGNTTTTYGQSNSFDYVPTQVYAQLSGFPDGYVSTDKVLDITVAGTGVVEYKYKIVDALNDSCSDSTGYSANISTATKISDSLTGYASGNNLLLCVVGVDNSGYVQNYETATTHQWVYSTNYRIDPIDFSSMSNMTDWRQVAIHPKNENIIFALNTMGEVWRTIDKGSNWELQCRTPRVYRTNMHLKVSPGFDGTAYISNYQNNLYSPDVIHIVRVDNIQGRPCPIITEQFRGELISDFVQAPFSINDDGEIYTLENQYDSVVIRKSLDQGRSWIFVSQLLNSGLSGQIYFNPLDSNYVLLNTFENNTGSGNKGLYRSTDGGLTWNFVQAAGFNVIQNIFFDPINAGRVYANNTYFSTNNGSSWSTDAQFNSQGYRWWVDRAGKGYRLTVSGSDTILQTSNNLTTPNFTSLYTFTGITSGTISSDHVTAAGNTITVVIGSRLFVSTNSGGNFTEILWPGSSLWLHGIASSDGGNNIFGLTRSWNFITSGNFNLNWTYKGTNFHNSCEDDGRLFAHHLDAQSIWAFSTCKQRGSATINGFNNYFSYNEDDGSGSRLIGTLNIGDYVHIETSLGNGYLRTLDYWQTSSVGVNDYNHLSSMGSFNPSFGFSKIQNTNTFFYIEGSALRELYYEDELEISASLNSRLTFTNPAAIAIDYDRYRLELAHLVVSQSGVVNRSSDDGKTFSLLGTSAPGLTTCSNRLFFIHPNDNRMMVTACLEGNEIAWSTNRASSWTKVDINSAFNMNCGVTGLVMTNAEIMFSCKSTYQAMKFSYTKAHLINAAIDNSITSSELFGNPIVQIDYPSEYSSIQYAIIPAGGTCSVLTTGFSATVPVDTDLVGLGDGSYQICVRLDNGTISYSTSTTITFDQTPPTFTSIDLVAAANDGIQLHDYLSTASNLVTNLVASNYNSAYYALVDGASVCDGSLNYKSSIPETNSSLFVTEGSYKVCVALSDGVNPPVYGASSVFNFSRGQVIAQLSNLPNKISQDTSLNVSVSGTNVNAYQYKVGAAPLDCTISTGYSAEISTATPITNNISAIPDGQITLCVRGIDNTNYEDQLFASATNYTWMKSNADINFAQFNVNNFHMNWFDVEIAKWDGAPHIYGRDFDGNVFLSTDRGVSFKNICSLPHDPESRISINRVKGYGAYATSLGKLYRLDDVAGEPCPVLSNTFTKVLSTFQRSPVAFNSKGDIYVIDEVSGMQSDLYKSSDLGESWTLVNSFMVALTNLTINIDPFNDDFFVLTYQGTPPTYADSYITSINGGATFFGVVPVAGSVSLIQDLKIDIKFDPANKGYAYANNGQYTSDYFFRLYDGTGNYVDDFSRWDMDQLGVGYRLVQNGADIDVETSSDMTSVNFSLYKKIVGVTANSLNRTVSVSADGATKAVVANKGMYISLDNGNFMPVYTPVVKMKISSITSEDSSHSYVVDQNWNFLKTSDEGVNWLFANKFNTACGIEPRVRTTKSDHNYVLAYAEDTTGSCADGMRSINGLSSLSTTALSWTSATEPSLALNPADKNQVATVASSSIKVSNNFMSTMSNLVTNTISNNGHGFDSFISPIDNTLIFNIVGSNLYEIDTIGLTKTSITGALTFANPAGLEGHADGTAYVISATGVLNQSLNGGGTFSAYSTNAALTSCTSRLMKSHPNDKDNIFATACNGGARVSYTLDAGANWKEINLASYSFTSSCTIRDIAILGNGTSKKLFVACKNLEALYIEMN